ncbi:carotenoid oxygenase family protein [Pannus brasiliensis CCIBt3594]|uniref:Carotenoid oxygenase family protein n=1 Tax=Pannus brasiliensis CCIBt3594 TaxID=1427578 RepID=A0AAW9QJE7_9CHRO
MGKTTAITESITEKSYNRQDWQRGYESQPDEYDYPVGEIEGQIPVELRGTLFRNGPGLLDIGGTPIAHPFDGDGMISAFTFDNGRVHYRNRYVRTEAYIREKAAGKPLYRGVFGTMKPGGWWANALDFRLKNIANTNILYWGDKLLALWEAAEPYRLDPRTLDTIGPDYLDGILQEGDPFSAHPRIDPGCLFDDDRPCLVNFAAKPGLSSQFTIFEFDRAGKLLRRHSHSLPGFSFIHDFAITPNYCIFFQNPVSFNPFPYLLGLKGAGECVTYEANQNTRIILIPRRPPHEDVKVVEIPSGFVFHHANAFERENTVCIDSICYDSLPRVDPDSSYKEANFEALDPGRLWRFTVDLQANSVKKELIESRCCEFPTLHPDRVGRDYRYLYIGTAHSPTGNAPLQAILKLDLQTGKRQLHSFAPRGFAGEPIFVPKPGGTEEDDGWLLAPMYDAAKHRSSLVILDARDLTTPVAIAHLKHHIPYGLHGSWTGEVF